jgi:plasmid stabilization system protein ParE
MTGYALHPEAFVDIDEIAAYIGQDSPDAAHRVVDDIYPPFRKPCPFPISDTVVQILPAAHCVSFECGII